MVQWTNVQNTFEWKSFVDVIFATIVFWPGILLASVIEKPFSVIPIALIPLLSVALLNRSRQLSDHNTPIDYIIERDRRKSLMFFAFNALGWALASVVAFVAG